MVRYIRKLRDLYWLIVVSLTSQRLTFSCSAPLACPAGRPSSASKWRRPWEVPLAQGSCSGRRLTKKSDRTKGERSGPENRIERTSKAKQEWQTASEGTTFSFSPPPHLRHSQFRQSITPKTRWRRKSLFDGLGIALDQSSDRLERRSDSERQLHFGCSGAGTLLDKMVKSAPVTRSSEPPGFSVTVRRGLTQCFTVLCDTAAENDRVKSETFQWETSVFFLRLRHHNREWLD